MLRKSSPQNSRQHHKTSTRSALDYGKKNQRGTESWGDRARDDHPPTPLLSHCPPHPARTRGLEEGERILKISARQSLCCHPIYILTRPGIWR